MKASSPAESSPILISESSSPVRGSRASVRRDGKEEDDEDEAARVFCVLLASVLTPYRLSLSLSLSLCRAAVRYPSGREEIELVRCEHELFERSSLVKTVFRVCRRPRLETRRKSTHGNEGGGFVRVRGKVETVSWMGVVVGVFGGFAVSSGQERIRGEFRRREGIRN